MRETKKFLDGVEPECQEFYRNLEPNELGQIVEVFNLLNNDRQDSAVALDRLLNTASNPAMAAFCRALLLRMRPVDDSVENSSGNLYLGNDTQLKAYDALLRTSLVPAAYEAGNEALLEIIGSRRANSLTLLDIGCGYGNQLRMLLLNPETKRLVKRIHIIGVEPNLRALHAANRLALEAAAEAGITASFLPLARKAEELTKNDIWAAEPRDLFLATSTLALHHLEEDARDTALKTVQASGATALVLVEADSNHLVDELSPRVMNAYRHYRTVWNALDDALGADGLSVWNAFFVPEIKNIICHDDHLRTERHENLRGWMRRLERAGYWVAPESMRTIGHQGVTILGVLKAYSMLEKSMVYGVPAEQTLS